MNREELLAWGFAFLVLGAIGDALTTMYTLNIYGIGSEVNPFLRDIVLPNGMWLLFVGKAVVIALFLFVYAEVGEDGRKDPLIIGVTWLSALWWIGLSISNLDQAGLL
jgi:membrane-bound metal-dependent hydrolase YbcI (DUF457 family)